MGGRSRSPGWRIIVCHIGKSLMGRHDPVAEGFDLVVSGHSHMAARGVARGHPLPQPRLRRARRASASRAPCARVGDGSSRTARDRRRAAHRRTLRLRRAAAARAHRVRSASHVVGGERAARGPRRGPRSAPGTCRPRRTPAAARARAGASHGAWTCAGVRPASSGTQRRT